MPRPPQVLRNERPAEVCFAPTAHGRIEYILIRSPRRRTVQISIEDSQKVKVHAPSLLPDSRIKDFILEKSAWIVRKRREAEKSREFLESRGYVDGQKFLFLGQAHPLFINVGKGARLRVSFDGFSWQIDVPQHLESQERHKAIKNKFVEWYKNQAKEVFGGRIFHYERVTGLNSQEIAVRGQKRVWGTCAQRRKKISLNWHLIMAPLTVIDYVVVHELAHLKHPNHSRRFWSCVERFCPGYKEQEKWLRQRRLEMILP